MPRHDDDNPSVTQPLPFLLSPTPLAFVIHPRPQVIAVVIVVVLIVVIMVIINTTKYNCNYIYNLYVLFIDLFNYNLKYKFLLYIFWDFIRFISHNLYSFRGYDLYFNNLKFWVYILCF